MLRPKGKRSCKNILKENKTKKEKEGEGEEPWVASQAMLL